MYQLMVGKRNREDDQRSCTKIDGTSWNRGRLQE